MTVFAFMVLQLEKHFSKTGLSLFECMVWLYLMRGLIWHKSNLSLSVSVH